MTVKKSITTSLIALGMILTVAIQPVSAAEVTFNSKRDCDPNAVLHCGTMNYSELQTKYNENDSARKIFEWFGITQQEVANMNSTAVAGYVTKDGKVFAGDKEVATNAMTAGRQNLTGSTKVTHDGATFYTRSPEVSFRNDRLDAFVVLDAEGKFEYAVIAACGNPVKANNTVVVKPAVVEKVVEKEVVVEKPVVVEEEVEVEKEVVVEKPIVVEQPVVLPEAGPASVVGLFAGSSALAAAGHALYVRRKR